MGKRKARLDKGGSAASGTGFIGFGAFADNSAAGDTGNGAGPSSSGVKWSPVYIGKDARLALIFKKLGQKSDGTTRARSLEEIGRYFSDDLVPKKEQVVALSHLVFLYHSKLAYNDFPSVRSSSLEVLHQAFQRLPKAWKTLILRDHLEIWGMIWCSQEDPAAEVKTAANRLCRDVLGSDATVDIETSTRGIVEYVCRIQQYGRPSAMHDALFARKKNPEPLSDTARDQLEERFERIVGTAVSGLNLWIQQHPERESYLYSDFIDDALVWKSISSTKRYVDCAGCIASLCSAFLTRTS